jgi:2-ketoarginine methyltransferase
MVDDNFEMRLIGALQPIRGFVLAQAVHHFFRSGVYDRMASGRCSVWQLADEFKMDPSRLLGFLRFLANEDLVVFDDDDVWLTPQAQTLGPFRPWYDLLVGGYAETFQQITTTLPGEAYASRDGAFVGIGSCGISQYDALPLVRRLVRELPVPPSAIIDLGCGDGRFLADLARGFPGIPAIGVDPFAPVDRDDAGVEFRRGHALDHVRDLAPVEAVPGAARPLFVTAFLLQEILGQDGRGPVVDLVRRIVRSGAWLAVVEVDHRPSDPAVMRHGLGLAYYNPYYLLHVLTEQELQTTAFWLELFEEAGAVVVARHGVDPRVDSTGLEFGCLLRGA